MSAATAPPSPASARKALRHGLKGERASGRGEIEPRTSSGLFQTNNSTRSARGTPRQFAASENLLGIRQSVSGAVSALGPPTREHLVEHGPERKMSGGAAPVRALSET